MYWCKYAFILSRSICMLLRVRSFFCLLKSYDVIKLPIIKFCFNLSQFFNLSENLTWLTIRESNPQFMVQRLLWKNLPNISHQEADQSKQERSVEKKFFTITVKKQKRAPFGIATRGKLLLNFLLKNDLIPKEFDRFTNKKVIEFSIQLTQNVIIEKDPLITEVFKN